MQKRRQLLGVSVHSKVQLSKAQKIIQMQTRGSKDKINKIIKDVQ